MICDKPDIAEQRSRRINGFFAPLAVVLATLAFCSCANQQNRTYPQYAPLASASQEDDQEVQMEVISEPPGAKIEFENEYFGVAPCVVTVRDAWGRDGKFGPRQGWRVLRAIPSQGGQFVQTKQFRMGDRIPLKVFFDMNLGPPTQEIDVNLNGY